MSHHTDRRRFIRGAFTGKAMMRPLGALPAMDFENACSQCGACARACNARIITRDSEGFPVVNLLRGECSFCNACTEACETGALTPDQPWNWRAKANDTCLSKSGIQCRTCEDRCETRAIRFRLQPGGRSEPVFNQAACTGCGACVAPCPVNAIEFSLISQTLEATPC